MAGTFFDELNISDIYSDVCEAIKMLNLNYPDLDKIVNLQSVDLTKKEREAKTEALNQAITELKPNKINILLVFGHW
ncbi:MAG: hypothetical protein EOM73_09720 [Bacteroidia bacterium]|nr:hypothetical protein [Bacteroidia bacterium]